MTSNKIPFSVEVSRMIEVLAAQIYPSPFALLRENIQNSFDAILLRLHAGDAFEPRIEVEITPRSVSVSDNGVGMSVSDLQTHFWKAGSSSKNTDDARAAGVVGTFGIGAMANFGIAAQLDVETESLATQERTRCMARRDTLSVTEDCISFDELVPIGQPGTTVKAEMQSEHPVDVSAATAYVIEFVANVDVPVYVNGRLVSQQPLDGLVPELPVAWRFEGQAVEIGPGFEADVRLTGAASGEMRIDLGRIRLSGSPVEGRLILRQGTGGLRTFRSRFGLATAAVASTYNFGGIADFLFLQPTAGREALTTDSLQTLQRLVSHVDDFVSYKIADRPESNNNSAFVSWARRKGRWNLCRHLRIRIAPGDNIALGDLETTCKAPILVYRGSDQSKIDHASEERPMVILSRQSPRRDLEWQFLHAVRKVEELSDNPAVLKTRKAADLSLGEAALAFRMSSILATDYFLQADIQFGKISNSLPILVVRETPVCIVLDPDAASIATIIGVYDREYGAFNHMVKDFIRTSIFPRVQDLVPSATRQGAAAFLKSIQRSQEIFEYESTDLESLTNLWKDYLGGKVTLAQAAIRSQAVQRSYQVISTAASASVRDIVPDVVENEAVAEVGQNPNHEAAPAIERLDISTDRKLLTIPDDEPSLKGYRCFLAITDRIREEKGDFFLQPHKTSVVWGGQKALFIFEHQSGGFGLYYDLQTKGLIADNSGGGASETSTIVMKNRIFIPIPEALRESFLPKADETKRFEVRCDILYIDRE